MTKKSSNASGLKKPCIAAVLTGAIDARLVKKALKHGAGAFEVRVDTFKDPSPAKIADQLKGLKRLARRFPVILTVRSVKEGGKADLSDTQRLELFNGLIPCADYVDIELSSSAVIKNVINSAKKRGKKVIVSYHNFKSTPGAQALEKIIRQGRAQGADIVKVATAVRRAEDLNALAGLLINEKGLAVIGMGALGEASRIFFPMLGSLFTFGSVSASTAPGQLPVSEIKAVWKAYGFN